MWDKRHTHTHNATPVYHGGSVRQGVHSPSCRSVATDKGDVLRPLLIQHSGKGLQILYLLSPHNSSGLGATHTHIRIHTRQGAHTHANQTSTNNTVHRQGPHKFGEENTHTLTAKSQTCARARGHTLCDTSPH